MLSRNGGSIKKEEVMYVGRWVGGGLLIFFSLLCEQGFFPFSLFIPPPPTPPQNFLPKLNFIYVT